MSHSLRDVLDLLMPVAAILGLSVYSVSLLFRCAMIPVSLMVTTSDSRTKRTAEQPVESSGNQSWTGMVVANKTTATLVFLLAYGLYPILTQNAASDAKHGIHDLIRGTDPLLDAILQKTPSLSRGPSPPLFLHNRHLQFVPWMLQNEFHRLQGIPFQRLELAVSACFDKSEGPSCLPSPLMNDTITLDIFPPMDDNSNDMYPGFSNASPVILFSPGLRCHSLDMPGTTLIRRAYGEGFRSIVINRRGHTPDQPLRAPRWNLFGDVPDLEQAYWFVKRQLVAPDTPLFLHGISSGTAVVVSALSEFDYRRDVLGEEQTPSFVASVSITPGYDTSKVLLPERFRFPYNAILTQSVKDHFVKQNEDVLRAFNSPAVDAALQATHLQDFLDAVAPFAGYPNATAYYSGENPINHLHHITTPKLVVNSVDDPCCNVQNLYEPSPRQVHDGKTFAQLVSESLRGMVVVSEFGSHCPFLDSLWGLLPKFVHDPLYGGWMLDSWADRLSVEFYKAALEVYNDRRFL